MRMHMFIIIINIFVLKFILKIRHLVAVRFLLECYLLYTFCFHQTGHITNHNIQIMAQARTIPVKEK